MMQLVNRGAQLDVVLAAGLLALAGLTGCGQEETELSLSGDVGSSDAESAFATPGFSCPDNRQNDEAGTITMQGDFREIAGAPEVRLERTQNIYGEYQGEQVSETLSESRVTRQGTEAIAISIDEELDLMPGIYDVVASADDGATARKEGALGILPRPTIERTGPNTACLDQNNARTLTISGGPFLTRDDEEETAAPDVRVGDYEVSDDDEVTATNCRDLGAPFGPYRACERLELDIDRDDLEDGSHPVSVTNIGPDACASDPEADGVQFAVASSPTLESADPAPLCAKQRTYESVELSGSNFVKLETDNATLRPTVTIGDRPFEAHRLEDCEEFQNQANGTAWRCSTAVVRIEAGELDRLVNRRSETQSSHSDAGHTDDADAGSGDDAGTADAGDTGSANDAGDPGSNDPRGPTPAYRLETLDVSLDNPAPALCSSDSVPLSVVPPPVVHDATPDPLCNVDQEDGGGGGAKTITIDGAGFLTIDGEEPTVGLDGSAYQPTSVEDCTALDLEGREASVETCDTLEIELPADELETGNIRDLTVVNPRPAGCKSEGSAPVQTSYAPEVTGVEPNAKSAPDSEAEPVCTSDGARTVTVYGSNFYVIDGETPEVAFGMAGSWRADEASGCEIVNVDDRSQDVRRCSILEVTVPEGELTPETDEEDDETNITQAYAVTVTNPNGADCLSSDSDTLFRTAIPPTIEADGLTENFACLDEDARSFTVTGEGFLRVETGSGMDATTRGPLVEVAGKIFRPTSVTDCSDVSLESGQMNAPSNTIETCNALTFTVPKKRLAPTGGGSPHQVRIHQPSPVACRGSASIPLTVDRAPSVTDVSTIDANSGGSAFQSAPACAEQTADQLVVSGEDFRLVEDANGEVTIDNTTYRIPQVDIADTSYQSPAVEIVDPANNCTELTGRSRSVLECSALAVATPAGKKGLGDGTHRVSVTNPSNSPNTSADPYGCASRTDHQVRFTAAPTLSRIAPSPACTGRPQNTLTAVGEDFLVVDPSGGSVQRPEVTFSCETSDSCGTVTETFEARAGRNCIGLTREAGQAPTKRCKRLRLSVPEASLPPGTYSATVQNPGGNECTSGSASLVVKPEPSVSDINPSPVCTAENSYVAVVEGRDFLKVDGATPSVTVGGANASVQSIRDCEPTTSPSGTPLETCTKLDVTLSQGSLSTGAIDDHRVEVTNPSPVDCKSEQSVFETDAPPPTVSSQDNSLYPACSGTAAETLVLTGEYYFEIAGVKPEVTITSPNNETRTYEDPTLGGNCDTLANATRETRHCDVMRIRMSKHTPPLSEGIYQVDIENPNTVQCTESGSFFVEKKTQQPPEITDIQPTRTCSTNGEVTITGNYFQRGIEVTLGGVLADNVDYVDSTEIRASWTGAPPGQDRTLSVENPDGCSATDDTTGIEVVQGPLAVFSQPPTHYNELLLESLLYIRGGDSSDGNASDVENVRIRGPNGGIRELQFTAVANKTDQLRVVLPDEDPNNQGQPLPPGSYDLQVTEQFGGLNCGQWQENALEVVGNQDLTLTDITPQSGFRQESTDVTINAAGNPPSGQTNFLPTPRAYLDPMPNTQGEEAIPLSNDIFHSQTKITATIPAQLEPGDYRVIVINPSPGREVGILSPPDGFTVASSPAPTVDTVEPGTWITPSNPQIEVRVKGQNFRVNSNQTAPVSVECKNGQPPNSITLKSSSSTELVLDLETDQMDRGDSCLLTVRNPDGTSAEYGPITTFNPQFDFVDFKDGPSLIRGRRGFVMESGAPTKDESFIYGIGGDNGPMPLDESDKNYRSHTTGEVAALDKFGDPASFSFLPYTLPSSRIFADGSRMRDFVYLVGGKDSADGQAQSDIYRANVLDPDHTPEIVDIEYEFEPVGSGGLSSGTYYYRVAAVHDGNAAHNPNGETLTSPVVPVYVPRYDDFDVQVKVSWDPGPVEDIAGYRLYRSPNPDVAVGTAQLFDNADQTTNTSYTDKGTPAPDGKGYIRTGALGQWNNIGDLDTARQRLKVRGAVDPNDPSKIHLYAYGGVDDGGTTLNDIERITIDDDPSVDRDSTLSSVTTLSSPSLSSARAEHAGFIASSDNSDILNTNLYSLGGASSGDVWNAILSRVVEWWTAQAGGSLSSTTTATDIDISRAGFVGTVANDYALVFGGVTTTGTEPYRTIVSSGSRSNELTNAGNITGWRDLGTINMEARYQHDGVAFGSFLYLGGGTTTIQITETQAQSYNNVNSREGEVTDTFEYSVIGKTRR